MVEKVVNLYSSEKLEEPINSEVYTSMEEAHDRLVAFSLSQGFDVVILTSTQRPQPVTTFSYVHHGHATRN